MRKLQISEGHTTTGKIHANGPKFMASRTKLFVVTCEVTIIILDGCLLTFSRKTWRLFVCIVTDTGATHYVLEYDT